MLRKFFSFSPTYDQTRLIDNYNAILTKYLEKNPSEINKFNYLSQEGVCSGHSTKWVKVFLSKPSHLKDQFFENIANITSLSNAEIKNIDYSKDNKVLKKVLDFGQEIQGLHIGKALARNIESKWFRDMMTAEWLYSTPLITSSKNLNISMENMIKPNAIFRFYSQKHIIPAITTDDEIIFCDSNDKNGEVKIPIDDIDGILHYLNERYAVMGHYLESASVFVEGFWRIPELSPKEFRDLSMIIIGSQNAEQIQKQNISLQEIVGTIEEKIKNINDQSISLLIAEIRININEFKNGVKSIDLILNDLLPKLNVLSNSISKYDNMKSDVVYIQAISASLSQYKNANASFDVRRIMKGLEYNTNELLKKYKEDDPEFELLKKIRDYTDDYFHGSLPVVEIFSHIRIALLLLQEKLPDNPLKLYLDFFKRANRQVDFMKTKDTILDLITDQYYQSKDGRDNLYVAIESGDTKTIERIIYLAQENKDFQIDLNKATYEYQPLELAIHSNRPDIVKLLIAHKADPTYINKDGYNYLMNKVALDNLDIMILLLKAGATKHLYTVNEKVKENFMDNYLLHNYINKKIETQEDAHRQKVAEKIVLYLFEKYPHKLKPYSIMQFQKYASIKNHTEVLKAAIDAIPQLIDNADHVGNFLEKVISQYEEGGDLNFISALIAGSHGKLTQDEYDTLYQKISLSTKNKPVADILVQHKNNLIKPITIMPQSFFPRVESNNNTKNARSSIPKPERPK